MSTKAEKQWKSDVAALGCAMCHKLNGPHDPGPVELHHLREGGWGKGDYHTLIPLCVNHHRGAEGIHHIGTKLWTLEFGVTQRELLTWTLQQLPNQHKGSA